MSFSPVFFSPFFCFQTELAIRTAIRFIDLGGIGLLRKHRIIQFAMLLWIDTREIISSLMRIIIIRVLVHRLCFHAPMFPSLLHHE